MTEREQFLIETLHIFTAKQQYRITELEQVLREIITISDRKHNAWDKAKELLNDTI
jgi:hypothetical protein